MINEYKKPENHSNYCFSGFSIVALNKIAILVALQIFGYQE